MLFEEDEQQVQTTSATEVFTADYLRHVHSGYKLGLGGGSSSANVFTSPQSGAKFLSSGSNESAAVYKAAARGCSTSIRTLVGRGASVNTPDNHGTTPAAVASGLGYIHVLKTLFDLGADLETKDMDGNSPLCIAAFEGNLQVINLLVSFGVDVNSPGMRGWTAVMITAYKGCDNGMIMESLVDSGADIDIRGDQGETALDLATTTLDIATALLLVNLGADIFSYLMDMVAPTADIHDLFDLFCQNCRATQNSEMCALFSLTKLMLSVQTLSYDEDESSVEFLSENCWEKILACAWQQRGMTKNIQHINHMSYDIRRRFILIANSVFGDSLSVDDNDDNNGVQLGVSPKKKVNLARRYVELVCFFCDEAVLREVLALRLTCRITHQCPRRFPVPTTTSYQELDSSLIESFIGYDAARFVSTKSIGVVIGIHAMLRV